VTKLSLAERVILLHLLDATDGNVIAVHGHRNVIVCKIADQHVVPCDDDTKDEDSGESCNLLSPEHEPEPRLDMPDESARFTPLNNFFILHNTCNNNTQQEVASTLGVSVNVSRMGGRK
jgi:hypothetical protein